MNKLLAIVALVAMTGTMAFAQQIDNKTFAVPVTINVAAEVSCWSGGAVALTLNGKNAENSDAVGGALTYINNVPAQISVQVAGTAYPSVNFFIFTDITTAQATAAMHANANVPAGSIAFTLNGPAVPVKAVAKSLTASSFPVVYAADAPNALPEVGSTNMTVTWTIAPQ